jgi:hypothetical protein
MPSKDERVLSDLQDHLAERLHRVLMDSNDTMHRAGVAERERAASLLAALMRELVCGMEALGGADEGTLLECFRLARRELHQALAKAEKAAQKKAH